MQKKIIIQLIKKYINAKNIKLIKITKIKNAHAQANYIGGLEYKLNVEQNEL